MTLRHPTILLALLGASSAMATWTAVVLPSGQGKYANLAGGFGGVQVGTVQINNVNRAALWSSGVWTDLHPSGSTLSFCSATNGLQHGGGVQIGGSTHAALWADGNSNWTDLAPQSPYSSVLGMEGNTQIGFRTIDDVMRATLWTGTAESAVDLHPPGAARSELRGIGMKQQVGQVGLHAALWTGRASSYVDLHPAGAGYSDAYDTDGFTQGGYASVGTQERAAIWRGTAASWVDLNPISATASHIYAVSGVFQVGHAYTPLGHRPYVWQGSKESAFDLGSVLPSDYTSGEAHTLWSDGETLYVGGNMFNSVTRNTEAVLWSMPDPENYVLRLNRNAIAGDNWIRGTIETSGYLHEDRSFTISDNSSLVTSPLAVVLPANATLKDFAIRTLPTTGLLNIVIVASRGARSRSQTLSLLPLVPSAMAFHPNSVTGGQPVSCRLVINGVAGAGGRSISLFDDSPYALTPSSVTVPPGSSEATFAIQTITPPSITTVKLTARVSAGEKTGHFRITP